jgi:hypothetical protein
MEMPKAAVDEDRDAMARQDEIGRAGQRPHMQSKAIAEGVHERAHGHLGFRVAPANRSHDARAGLLADAVHRSLRQDRAAVHRGDPTGSRRR